MGLFGYTSNKLKYFRTNKWDERLYHALFARTKEWNLVNGHSFSCLLVERNSEINAYNISHKYLGIFELWLSDDECFEIPVKIDFEDDHESYKRRLGNFELGNCHFCDSYMGSGGRSHLAMTVTILNQPGLSDNVAKLYAEVKAVGGKGLTLNWWVILKDLVGLSAEQVWGDGPESDEDPDEYGIQRLPKYPGRRPFALERFSFEAKL